MIAKINNREHEVVYIDYRDGNIPHQVYTICLDKYRQLFSWDFFANNGDKRDIRYYNAGFGGDDKEIQASNWAKGIKGKYWLAKKSCLDGKSNGKRLKEPLRIKGYAGNTSINPFMVAEHTNCREYCEKCGNESTEFCYEHKYEDKDEKHVCERCEKDVDETYPCERCETMICDACQAGYNQFSQIDYNCCQSCANGHYDTN